MAERLTLDPSASLDVAAPAPNRRAFEGWRAEIGIPELDAIVRYVKRPFGVTKLAQHFTELIWPDDEAIALALIVSRLAELNYERRTVRS